MFFKLAKNDSPAHYPNNIRVWPTDCRSSSSAKVAEYSPDIYLAAAVGRRNAVFFELVVAHGHLQRAGDPLGAYVIGHRIADHRLVEAIDHRRQMQPALPRLDVVSPTSWPQASARQ